MKRFAVLLCLAMLVSIPNTVQAAEGATDPIASDKVQSDLDTLKSQINEPEGAIQTTIADVKKLKKITLSGYVQVRWQYDQGAKVATDSGDTRNTFDIRRARLKGVGRPNDNSQVTLQFDMGGTGVITKDANVAYFLKGDPGYGATITAGQFVLPFGYQNVQSSSTMETPERAQVISRLFPGEYGRGVKYSTPTDNRLYGEVGLFNSTPQNTIDTGQAKPVVGRIRYRMTPNLETGISGYFGGKEFVPATAVLNADGTIKTTAAATYPEKDRIGADFQYHMDNMSLKGEYVHAKDRSVTKSGYYLLLSRNLTKKDRGVVMYDVFTDPTAKLNNKLVSRQHSWNLGYVRWLDDATRVRVFYQLNGEQTNPVKNDNVRVEVISLF